MIKRPLGLVVLLVVADAAYYVKVLDATRLPELYSAGRAFVKYDPPDCRVCFQLDEVWHHVALRLATPTWSVSCEVEPELCVGRDIPLLPIPTRQPIIEVWTGSSFVRYDGPKEATALLRFLETASDEDAIASSVSTVQGVSPRFRSVPRSLQLDAARMSELVSSPLTALVRYDPAGCVTLCTQAHTVMRELTSESELLPPGGVWFVSCSDTPDLCADREADWRQLPMGAIVREAVASAPKIELWNGTAFALWAGSAPSKHTGYVAFVAAVMKVLEQDQHRGGCYGRPVPAGWAEDHAASCQTPGGIAKRPLPCAGEGQRPYPTDISPNDDGSAPCFAWWPAVTERARALGGVQLDERGYVYVIRGFLSEAEVAHMLAVGTGSKGKHIDNRQSRCDRLHDDLVMRSAMGASIDRLSSSHTS